MMQVRKGDSLRRICYDSCDILYISLFHRHLPPSELKSFGTHNFLLFVKLTGLSWTTYHEPNLIICLDPSC